MSSEMREPDAMKFQDAYRAWDNAEGKEGGLPSFVDRVNSLLAARDEQWRTLLARTEAGEDGKPGSVAKRKRIELEDRGYVVNGVCFKHPESGEQGMLCNGGSVHWLARPQDASGDAVAIKAHGYMQELEAVKTLLRQAVREAGDHMSVRLFDEIDTYFAAMQAKEAK